PHAGHTAMIADFHQGQSLIQTLLANGIDHVALTDWKSATDDMKDFEIDNYLADMVVVIDDLGGRVNLVGLCQGGWVSAMIAARFPDKVNSLVLAGAPIDTDAGDGPIKRMAKASPMSFYEELVGLGGGLMKGKYMLQGWKARAATIFIHNGAPSSSLVGCLGPRGLLHRLDLFFHGLESGSEHGGRQLGDVLAIADSGFNPFFDQPLL